ncbi:MAG TPA: hypothetical protein VGG10_15580 [Rhizomicrobium sp.]|jgi:hypothetical protein
MRNVVFAAVSVLALSAAPITYADEQAPLSVTTAAPVPTTTPATPVAAAKDPNEIECRRLLNTGELTPGPKVCHTRAQWEEIQYEPQ